MSGRINPVPHGSAMTPVEWEVLRLAALGLSDKEIARRRGTSENTVKDRFVHAFQRLGVRSRIEAFRAVGWLRLPE